MPHPDRRQRRVLVVVAATALVVLPGTPPVGAADVLVPDGKRAVAVQPSPVLAAGVVVRTTGPDLPQDVVAAAADAVEDVVEQAPDLASRSVVAESTFAIPTEGLISLAEAAEVAQDLQERPDVVWAEPNQVFGVAATAPVRPRDPYFPRMKNLWDSRPATHGLVATIDPSRWPAGGFSSKAPSMWRATQGRSSVVVAVVDTGVKLDHPDLVGRLVPGYDFVSSDAPGVHRSANDGDGRDADPSDPGDWDAGGECGLASPAQPSSWHGTHVAGTVVARADGAGVVGVAPGVRVQPVRVLGRCGGTLADIAAGIRWAAGNRVAGAPANRTPAKVVNVSLGGTSATCSNTYRDAIAAARSRGAVVVAAAGNGNRDAAGYSPANCPGAIAVGATSEFGDKAAYSNHGSHVDLSAPGGDQGWYADARGRDAQVWSTHDTGRTTPLAPSHAELEGTSMATPAVAGAAALLLSVRSLTGSQLESALLASRTSFPTAGHRGFDTCRTGRCGRGILDLSQVQAPLTKPTVTGTRRAGRTLKAGKPRWVRTPSSLSYQWLRNGRPIGNASSASYTLRTHDVGQRISVRVAPRTGAFRPFSTTSSRTGAIKRR